MVKHGTQVCTWMAAAALLLSAAEPLSAQAALRGADQVRARQRILMMEGALETAVKNGADNLLRQIDTAMPDAATLTGAPLVRGFRLEGYGLFFDVAVPGLQVTLTWPLRALLNDARTASLTLAQLKARMAQMSAAEREAIAPLVRQLELALPPAPPRSTVSAALAAPPGPPAAPPPVSPADPDVLNDPQAAWTREVKTALVEAMLEHSGPLNVSADEWLTVAASDFAPRDPLTPGATVDLSTVVFRVKGSDLAEFHARRITLDEARKRVEVREY